MNQPEIETPCVKLCVVDPETGFCIGCGRTRPKHELERLALDGDIVVADPAAVRPGRGAYVCNGACMQRALDRKALARAFRSAVKARPDTLESLRT